ncbi:hypothetical protein HBH92_074120 [Parastagonospora nodorum]|nr:hypothetical protein HBH92_074120 [Parastagonospora nodorum]KAH4509013.1 hypothetical protein HBH89_059210 [Parastagonospora nodorum]KAH4557505.1 hypothetical protein HBH86_081820 [Parastagonospora nodorum]KAH4874931.1 hypothetical protein HBH59_093910 [Parastagonospora nodorum]KAH4882235.1 hypothetical protein HBH58_067370 [Parastagonospora nodorum]
MSTIDIPKEMWALLDDQPLVQAPTGITPNFEYPTWHGRSVVIAASVCIPLMLIAASIRVYTKCFITRKWNRDDNIFLASLAAALLFIALVMAMTCGGAYGYHAWDLKIGRLTKVVLVRSLLLTILVGPLVWIIKLSIFSLIYHAFRPLPYVRRLVYVGVLVTGLYSVGTGITNGILCGPHGGQDRAAYLAGMAGPKCGNPDGVVQILSVTTGSINLFTDIYLLFLPLPAVYDLSLPRARKAGVMAIFLTGSVGCVMSAIALYYRKRTYGGGRVTLWNTDITYANNPIMTVTIIESAVGIMIPCMASCAKVFKLYSSSLSSFMPSRFTGFRRTPSNDGIFRASQELQRLPGISEQPHTDTIDRMLMQFKHDEHNNDSFSQDSQSSKTSRIST